MTVKEINAIVSGSLMNVNPEREITGAGFFDSRSPIPNGIFVALVGEKVDGHTFIPAAIAGGAGIALASVASDQPCILVPDVLAALALLAAHVRKELSTMKVIAITGSHGKTTCKDFLAHILQTQGETVAPLESFNNDLGLPLTLLRATRATKFCVLEMGARHRGDIARLTEIARPDLGVVLKVGSAHLGEFGSREKIAEAKGELIEGLSSHAIAVLGTYDEFTPMMGRSKFAAGGISAILTFGENPNDSVRAADIEVREGCAHFDLVTSSGREAVGLRLIGLHQISNALAAAAAATALAVPIEVIASALSTAQSQSKWRMELHEYAGLLVINDCYNANPESTTAALHTLALLSQERGGRSWAFLGRMHELGSASAQAHEGIGRLTNELGIDHLVAVGARAYMSGESSRDENFNREVMQHFVASQEEAAKLFPHFEKGDAVLVKASRAEHFESLTNAIFEFWKNKNQKIESEEATTQEDFS